METVIKSTLFCALLGLLAVEVMAADPAPATSKDKTFAGKTAWQMDEKFELKWQEITGRFIFQRACLGCHEQGPAAFTRAEWKQKLEGFPDEEHDELLPEEFEDLTAMFSYGRMMANNQARYQSLETFLLKHAPEKRVAEPGEDLKDAVDLLPIVGQVAPDFSIVDTQGKKHTLKSYIQNKEALILVFSRAHW